MDHTEVNRESSAAGPVTADSPAPPKRAMIRTFRLSLFCMPLLLMFLLGLTPGISMLEDLGRHLQLGRIIIEQRAVPKTNLLSYTHPDFPFVNHHWLSEVVFYLGHSLAGLNGLILGKAVLLTMALLIAMRTVPAPGSPALVSLAALLAAVMLGFRAHIRPEVFTYLGIALFGYCFEGIRRGKGYHWAILAIYGWFWANAHIYFIFGLGMIFSFLLERWWHRWLEGAAGWGVFPWKEAAFFAGIVCLCAIQPNGLAGLLYPFSIFDNYALAIVENSSPLELWRKVLNPMLLALPVMTAMAIVALLGATLLRPDLRGSSPRCGRSGTPREAGGATPLSDGGGTCGGCRWAETFGRRMPRLGNHIVLVTALAAAWTMARSAPLLALTALPVVAEALVVRWRGIWAAGSWDESPGSGGTGNGAMFGDEALPDGGRLPGEEGGGRVMSAGEIVSGVAALAFGLWLVFGVVDGWYCRVFPSPVGPTPFGFDTLSRYLRLRELKGKGLPTPIFTDFNIGSLAAYNIAPEKGYADNRPEAFPEDFWRGEYLPALQLGETWEKVILGRGIQSVAVSPVGVGEWFVSAMMADQRWRLVHLDEFVAVWTLATNPANREFINRNLFTDQTLAVEIARIEGVLASLPEAPFWRRQVLADEAVYRLYGLLCIGAARKIWPLLWKMYLLYPDYQVVHEMLRVSAPPEGVGDVKGILAREARWPLSAKQVLDRAGTLAADGLPAEASKVVRRGRFFFPLSRELREAEARLDAIIVEKNL